MYGPALQAGKLAATFLGLRTGLCLMANGSENRSDLDLWVNQWASAIELAPWLQQQATLDFVFLDFKKKLI